MGSTVTQDFQAHGGFLHAGGRGPGERAAGGFEHGLTRSVVNEQIRSGNSVERPALYGSFPDDRGNGDRTGGRQSDGPSPRPGHLSFNSAGGREDTVNFMVNGINMNDPTTSR